MGNFRHDTITEDTIEKLSHYDLKKLYLSLRGRINRGRRNKRNTRELEIDLCYVQREIEARRLKF